MNSSPLSSKVSYLLLKLRKNTQQFWQAVTHLQNPMNFKFALILLKVFSKLFYENHDIRTRTLTFENNNKEN